MNRFSLRYTDRKTATWAALTGWLLMAALVANEQEIMPLYSGAVPNSKASDVQESGTESGVLKGITKPTLAYLTHAADDKLVDVDNSIRYFETLRHQKVPVEMHIYPKGDHGFIFRHPGWMDPLFAWMKLNNWLKTQ